MGQTSRWDACDMRTELTPIRGIQTTEYRGRHSSHLDRHQRRSLSLAVISLRLLQ